MALIRASDLIKDMKPVTVSKFAFSNTQGGTMLSNWQFNEPYTGKVEILMTAGWLDYETGYRFIGKAVNREMRDYLARNSHDGDVDVFFSEFDIPLDTDRRLLVSAADAIERDAGEALDLRMNQSGALEAWCNRHGFKFDAELAGVICMSGTPKLVFGISYAKGKAEVYPDGCGYRHHYGFSTKPDTFTLFPAIGDTVDQFLRKLEDSMCRASAGLDMEDRPYDHKAILDIALSTFSLPRDRKPRPGS